MVWRMEWKVCSGPNPRNFFRRQNRLDKGPVLSPYFPLAVKGTRKPSVDSAIRRASREAEVVYLQFHPNRESHRVTLARFCGCSPG
jgi:hypothetical protein